MKRLFALTSILTIAVMSIGASGCASHDRDLKGTFWQLVEYGAQASPATILDGTTITLDFNADATRITGNGGCNDYFADCVIDGGNITVTNLGSTKMNNDDPPGTMIQENNYFNLLKTAERLEIDGDNLTINCKDGQVLVFEKTRAASLNATSWHLESYGPASQQKSLLPSTAIKLVFDADAEHFSGNASVNSYGGDCAVLNNALTISNLYQTEMASNNPPGIMQQESDYLTLLSAAESFEASDNSLTIYCQGDQVLVFTREGYVSNTELAGTSWHLACYGEGFWQTPPIPFTKITLSFDEDTMVARGTAGVNLYGFDYVVSEDRITVSQVTRTLLDGVFPVIKQENRYLTLLSTAESFSVSDNSLTIYCSGGEELHFRLD